VKFSDKKTVLILAMISLFLLSGTVFAQLEREELLWSIGVYTGSSPFDLNDPKEIDNPVFTYKDITDREALFVADPFIFEYEGKYLMFLEVALAHPYGHGDLAYATSDDGIHWEYQQVILDEPFHLSYPQVFEYEGEYYMIPETWETATLRLYKATNFPTEWKLEKTLVDIQNVDPSIFRQDDMWYIILASNASAGWDTTRIYMSEELTGDWTEHPMSPIIEGDTNVSRPAGRVMKYDGHWYRTAQDCSPTYGQLVNAWRIDKITPTVYKESPLKNNPALAPTGEWWGKDGMHQIDAIKLKDGKWLGVIDGQSYQQFKFKITPPSWE